jgi:hypothetical protein
VVLATYISEAPAKNHLEYLLKAEGWAPFPEFLIQKAWRGITEIEKSTLKFIWKHKETANSQGNTQQKEQCWRYHNTQLETIL